VEKKQKEASLKSDETPFQRFEHLIGKLVSVPKKEIDQREREWRKKRKRRT
jgi:hypothetical protein